MPTKKLKLRRLIRTTDGITAPPTRSPETMTVERSSANHIRNLPPDEYNVVVESLRDGIAHSAIAAFFAEQGLLSVGERTFVNYLGCFGRMYPELIRGESDETLNHYESKRKPHLDEEVVLEQLLRVQSRRLKIGHDFEKNTGILNGGLYKDIRATRELAESLAKIRGKGQSVGRPSADDRAAANVSPEAQANLRGVRNDEAAQGRITAALGQLGKLLKDRNTHAKADTSKA